MSGAQSPLFVASFDEIIGVEGGYTNNPADPGGETKWGISKRAYPSLDIPNLTQADAQAIYYPDYWVKASCELCPAALAFLVFDAAVNNGVGAAIKFLQEGVNTTPDGIIGPATRAAIAALGDPSDAIANMHGARILYMASLPTWSTFGKGWARRLARMPYRAAVIAASVGGSVNG